MKRMVIFAFLAVVGPIVGCSDNNDKNANHLKAYAEQRSKINEAVINEAIRFYKAPHQMRKMFVKEKDITVEKPTRAEYHRSFFLFFGGADAKYEEGVTTKYVVTHVRFAWEIKDNTYITTTIPIEKTRIKLAEKVKTPAVSFVLDESVRANRGVLNDYYDPQEALSKYLKYAVFTVRSKDWPQDINLPSGGFGQ